MCKSQVERKHACIILKWLGVLNYCLSGFDVACVQHLKNRYLLNASQVRVSCLVSKTDLATHGGHS